MIACGTVATESSGCQVMQETVPLVLDEAFHRRKHLEGEWQVDARSQQFSKNPWSPFDGRRARARVVRTLVRGETVYAYGEIVAEPGSGRFLSCHGDHALAPGSP